MRQSDFTTLTIHVDGRLIAIRREDVRVVESEGICKGEHCFGKVKGGKEVVRIRHVDGNNFVVEGSFAEILLSLENQPQ